MLISDAFRGFTHFSRVHGPEQARLIIENEKLVLQDAKDFVEAHNVDCDFNYTTTFEVCLDEAYAKSLAESFAQFRDAGGDVSQIKYYEGEDARGKTKVRAAICAYEWPAASNHPGKLCQWILNDVIKSGGRLWTHCPATKISKHRGQGKMRWDIHTPRGIISARTVLHCTNAYAATLLPELSGVITPRRAQCHSYVPPASLSGENTLKSTLSLRYGARHYFSVNQLKDGTLVFGGQASRSDADWTQDYHKDRTSFDDGNYNPQVKKNSVREFSNLIMDSSSGPSRPGEGFSHVWTGIVGETPDTVPFVGPIDGMEGQWICAGFNGHGECIPLALV